MATWRVATALLLIAGLAAPVLPSDYAAATAERSARSQPSGQLIVAWSDPRDEGRVRVALGARGFASARRLYGGRGVVVDLVPGLDAAAAALAIAALPGVAYAEPDYPVTAQWVGGVPNDPYYADGTQWAPRRVQAEAAWSLARGDGVTIAIVDTGVDLGHSDLAAKIWANPGEIPGNGIDDDGNGFVDDVIGWNFVSGTPTPTDDNGHGTHCAGIAAAATDNALGIAGMAPGARIMAVKVLDSRGSGSTAALAEGIDYAVDAGADIISASIGGTSGTKTLEGAVRRATAAGVLVVAASGNEGGAVLYPAAYTDALSVGATDRNDVRTTYSNFGPGLDIVAPGGSPAAQVLSTVRSGEYGSKYGTSMATPHVAGIAALLKGERPELSPSALGFIIQTTALDLGAPGRDDYHGYGLAQAGPAVATMLGDTTPPESHCTTAVAPPEGVMATIFSEDIGLGVDRVVWRLSGALPGGAEGVGSRVEVTYPGAHVLEYAAVDRAGNREATRAVSLEVTDTLPPVTTTDARDVYYGGSALITLTAIDRGIGVAETSWSLDGGPAIRGTTVLANATGDHTLAFRSVDLLGHEENTRTVSFRVYGTADVSRVSGVDRYGTAIEASRYAFPTGSAPVAVVASGQDFPDALAASGLAGTLGAPVLLARADGLPTGLLAELTRLGTRRVVLIGGVRALGERVELAISEQNITVERVWGPDRYATAAAVAGRIAEERGAPPEAALIARGDAFPDALAVAPIAYGWGYPVLLTRPDALPQATAEAVSTLRGAALLIAGGSSAVTPGVAEQVSKLSGSAYERVGGRTRYETASLLARHARDRGWASGTTIGVVTGEDFPDALSGGAAAGVGRGVVLLTRPNVLSSEARGYIASVGRSGDPVRVFGGRAAVSHPVLTELKAIPLL
jgi:subtilisin family serine protease/putative cell wall-binding protein